MLYGKEVDPDGDVLDKNGNRYVTYSIPDASPHLPNMLYATLY